MSTVRVSVATVRPGESGDVFSVGVAGPPVARLSLGFRRVLTLARELEVDRTPVAVYVEQPSGAHPNPELTYMVGAVIAAIGVAMPGVPATTIPPGTWKKHGLGYGAAKIDQIIEWARREHGYDGAVHDEAAALGIATGGAALGIPPPKLVVR